MVIIGVYESFAQTMDKNNAMSTNQKVHMDVVFVHLKSYLCVGEEHVMAINYIGVFIMS